jgi:hypothetical protein
MISENVIFLNLLNHGELTQTGAVEMAASRVEKRSHIIFARYENTFASVFAWILAATTHD